VSNVTQLRLRKPTGVTPWPIVVLEGAEKVGKTYEALRFSGNEHITDTWAIDLGEDSLDQYRDIPGARFEVIEHDGTWVDIMSQLEAAVAESERIAEAGGLPYLVVDTGTAEWNMLTAWVWDRAKRTKTNRKILAEDPDAAIKASRNLWNDADTRHRAFWSALRRFRGPVVITARGKWVSATGENGQPLPAVNGVQPKEYRVEGHKGLAFDAHAWVRFSRDEEPTIVGLRHVKYGIRPGRDKTRTIPDFTLDWLIFDLMDCQPGVNRARGSIELSADQVAPGEEITDPDQESAAQQAQRQQDQRTGRQRQAANQAPVPVAQRAAQAVDYVLGAADVHQAGVRQEWAGRQGAVSRSDVGALLTERDRDELSIAKGQKVTLVDLAAAMCTYVGSNKRAVRPAAPSLVDAAEKAAAIASGQRTYPDGTTQAELDEHIRDAREIAREAVA
jgi:hypothetical protein